MKTHLSFHEVCENDISGLSDLLKLAREIWTEHFTPIIGQAQVNYMLAHFQSFSSVRAQIGEGVRYFLVEWDGKRVGYCAAQIQVDGGKARPDVFLSKLYILATYRGRGLGRRSLRYLENLAREVHAERIWLTVNKGNLSAIRFYERQGFRKSGAIVKDIGGGYEMDDFVMEKSL